ncbi:MAG: helix-turn-helix transcriptional regulator [Bacteroidia bacterium]|nr:helix-turn-helix transcriptional regulator [Bacteroidia bacterium]
MKSALNQRIRKIREAKNLTQEELAAKCGMSASAYG